MIKEIAHYVKLAGAYSIQIMAWPIPLNPKIIVFYAHKRKGLCCNPKYIMRYMMERYPEDYKYYWVTEFPESMPEEKGYSVIKKRSMKYYQLLSCAKLFITNDMVDETLLKRKGQIYLSTWHGGGAYKKVGFDVKEAKENWKILDRWYGRLDYLILSNGFLQKEYKRSFRINNRQMLKTGMPRSDIFYHNNGIYDQIRKLYCLQSDIKILLYAPTYRYGKYELLSEKELMLILKILESRFGGEWVCFYRMHYFDSEHKYNENSKIYNANDYADVQEFLCATDILITDYSSLLWDFTLLKKPCFSYAKSPEKFEREERDFYLPYEEWPYPKAATICELTEQIERFDQDIYIRDLERYMEKLDHYETGNSTESVVKIIREICR